MATVEHPAGADRVEDRRAWRPLVAVLAAAVLFGTTGTAQQLGPDDTTPLGVGAVRVAIGAVGLLVAARVSGRRAASGTPWRRTWPSIVVAGCGVAGYQVGFFVGTDRAGVALGTLVALGSGPVFAGVHAAVSSRRPPSVGWTLATVAAAAGAGLVAFGQEGASGSSDDVATGVVAALLAGLSYAVFSIAGKRVMDAGVTSATAMAAAFTAGAVALSPLLIVEPMGWLTTGRGLALALHLGLAATALAYALFGFGLARLAVPTVVTLTLFEPGTAAVLSVVALSQPLAAVGWSGVALVMIGVALVALIPVGGETAPLAE